MSNIGLLRHELDGMRCSEPTCDHRNHEALYLHSSCHTKSPTAARFFGNGSLVISCGVCEAFVARIAVGHEDTARLAPQTECGDPDCTSPPADHCLVFGHKRGGKRDGVFCVYGGDGKITILCAHCDGELDTVAVRQRTADA